MSALSRSALGRKGRLAEMVAEVNGGVANLEQNDFAFAGAEAIHNFRNALKTSRELWFQDDRLRPATAGSLGDFNLAHGHVHAIIDLLPHPAGRWPLEDLAIRNGKVAADMPQEEDNFGLFETEFEQIETNRQAESIKGRELHFDALAREAHVVERVRSSIRHVRSGQHYLLAIDIKQFADAAEERWRWRALVGPEQGPQRMIDLPALKALAGNLLQFVPIKH